MFSKSVRVHGKRNIVATCKVSKNEPRVFAKSGNLFGFCDRKNCVQPGRRVHGRGCVTQFCSFRKLTALGIFEKQVPQFWVGSVSSVVNTLNCELFCQKRFKDKTGWNSEVWYSITLWMTSVHPQSLPFCFLDCGLSNQTDLIRFIRISESQVNRIDCHVMFFVNTRSESKSDLRSIQNMQRVSLMPVAQRER